MERDGMRYQMETKLKRTEGADDYQHHQVQCQVAKVGGHGFEERPHEEERGKDFEANFEWKGSKSEEVSQLEN